MSGDPEQEYFADGITEDIITDLAARRPVRDRRNTAFAYKGSAVDIGRSRASSASATCSRAACARPATECGSRRS